MVLNLDDTNANADWIKNGAWDIPATTPEELTAWLGARGMTPAEFRTLPVYRLNQHRLPWLAAFGQVLPDA